MAGCKWEFKKACSAAGMLPGGRRRLPCARRQGLGMTRGSRRRNCAMNKHGWLQPVASRDPLQFKTTVEFECIEWMLAMLSLSFLCWRP